jgi:hypothetical protein
MQANEMSKRQIASIVISAVTAGFAGASISYDFDVDPSRRRQTPDYYGYMPDGLPRTLIFGCMVVNGALLLLSRSICAALLMLIGKRYMLWYFLGDMGIYLLQKIARGDFYYWLPLEGVLGFVVSVLMRLLVKVVVDYTGIVQFRGAPELGGIYWSMNMLVSIGMPLAVVRLYYYTVTLEADRIAVEEGTMRWIVGLLSGAWVLFFGGFLALMKKKYRRTFVSLETGNDWAQAFFVKGETDRIKSAVVEINTMKWKPIEGDVKKWVQDSWEKWEEEQPEWFDDIWTVRIPYDWLTPAELRRQKVAGGGQRRRSSRGELLGGSVRERKRSAAAVFRRGSATVVPKNDAEIEGGGGFPFTVVEEEPSLGEHFDAVTEEEGGEKGVEDGIVYVPADDEPNEKSGAVES